MTLTPEPTPVCDGSQITFNATLDTGPLPSFIEFKRADAILEIESDEQEDIGAYVINITASISLRENDPSGTFSTSFNFTLTVLNQTSSKYTIVEPIDFSGIVPNEVVEVSEE